MNSADFDYRLPKILIAQKPLRPRDSSRLMVVDTASGKIHHLKFRDIGKFLKAGDALVLNDTKVMLARLWARKKTRAKVEILLLRQIDGRRWQALLRNYRMKEGPKKLFIAKGFYAKVEKNIENNIWLVKFNLGGSKLKNLIKFFGQAPTPPYIKLKSNLSEYQTVYAKHEGSAAAPTAGFHFTKSLIKKLKKQGIVFQAITLHVGLGTFEPIRVGEVESHKIHSEWARLNQKTAKTLNQAKKQGARIIAVGTTSARTLESFTAKGGTLRPGEKEVNLYIYPPYNFKIIDGLVTNFHLPKSTLILMVSAFLQFKKGGDGAKDLINLYKKAIKQRYRFYSFGDAMMII